MAAATHYAWCGLLVGTVDHRRTVDRRGMGGYTEDGTHAVAKNGLKLSPLLHTAPGSPEAYLISSFGLQLPTGSHAGSMYRSA